MKIGNLKLKSRVFLAPMLEPNDIAFRMLCKKCGCALTWTGMVSPLSRRKLDLDDKPVLQLFGDSVRGIKSFMKKYDSKVSGWDFNLGCPSKLSRKFGHGVFMHDDVEGILKIVKTMRSSTKKPVIVKLRKSSRAIEIARAIEPYIDAIGIHARSASQGYSGEVDYDFALELKNAVKVPVIFSGDVRASRDGRWWVVGGGDKNVLRDFDFVFVGREAIGNPSVFQMFGEVGGGRRRISKSVDFDEYLKLARKYGLFFRQIKFQAMNFSKGMRSARRIREKLVFAENVGDIESIIDEFK